MIDEKELFQEENKPESNWFKFEKVGDRVFGEVVDCYDKEGDAVYPAQKVWALRQDDGSVISVGISTTKDYIIARASQAMLGDVLGFEFVKEIPATTKGFNPAKSIEVYVRKNETVSDEQDS